MTYSIQNKTVLTNFKIEIEEIANQEFIDHMNNLGSSIGESEAVIPDNFEISFSNESVNEYINGFDFICDSLHEHIDINDFIYENEIIFHPVILDEKHENDKVTLIYSIC